MNPFKTLALTLFLLLALFANDAMAQCSGKKVSIQLPLEWPSNNIYFLLGGNWVLVTNTAKAGEWNEFTLPTINNDNATANIVFSSLGSYYDAGGMMSISPTTFVSGTAPANTGISCANNVLVPQPGTTYISRVEGGTATIVNDFPPNTQYFYFFPPDDEAWILGTPYLVVGGGTPERLEPDPIRCGWYKKVWFKADDPPPTNAVIWLGNPARDKIGTKGWEDPAEWEVPGIFNGNQLISGSPAPINFKEIFSNDAGELVPGDRFFVSQQGRWATTDPGSAADLYDEKRCKYKFAANIYYKGHDWKGTSEGFSFYGEGGTGEGLCRGYVKPDLVQAPNDPSNTIKKMVFDRNVCNGDWTSAGFDKAFNNQNLTPSPYRHVCYDMPFERKPDGNWEFDAYYMTQDGLALDYSGRNTRGGFYLPTSILGPMIGPAYNGDKIGVKPAHKFCFDRGRQSRSAAGDNATALNQCGAEWPNGSVMSGVDAHDDQGENGYGKVTGVTGLLCFESSPAQFTYDKGQEFFFRGDDDIWVFINNKLALDMGGNHMPVGGYINLDNDATKLGLEVGKKYPINIFFCDRRGTGSNVRISTNLYFSQRTGLFIGDDKGNDCNPDATQCAICVESSGSGSCGGGNAATSTKCGSQIPYEIEFYIQNRNGEQTILEPNNLDPDYNDQCVSQGPDVFICYGGITIYPNAKKVYVNKDKITGLTGSQSIYARAKTEEKLPPVFITKFSISTYVQVVWGKVVEEGSKKLIRDFGTPKDIKGVAGKLFPVGFASASEVAGGFEVNMDGKEGSPGQGFTLSQAGLRDATLDNSGLKIFHDELGLEPAKPGDNFTIPPSGLKVLWVTGSYDADDDAAYSVSVSGKADAVVNATFYLPRLRFTDHTTVEDNANPRPLPAEQTKGSRFERGAEVGWNPRDMSVNTYSKQSRAVVAYDPTSAPDDESKWVVCESCNSDHENNPFILEKRAKTSIERTGTPKFGEDGKLMEFVDTRMQKGIAKFGFYGKVPVAPSESELDTFAIFTIGGPSTAPKTLAKWDMLLFKEIPVPRPDVVEIFDKDGDGIGDLLRITYDRRFKKEDCGLDSLPNYIEVLWEAMPEDGREPKWLGFGLAKKNKDGEYDDKFATTKEERCVANRNYWTGEHSIPDPYGTGNITIKLDVKDTVKKINEKDSTVSVITISGAHLFSKDIKTAADPFDLDRIQNWSTFIDDSYCAVGKECQSVNQASEGVILDKIPAIVTYAFYTGDDDCGFGNKDFCKDMVEIKFSEPVVPWKLIDAEKSEITEDGINVAFDYKLIGMKKDLDWSDWTGGLSSKNPPYEVVWENFGKSTSLNLTKGEKSVKLRYYSRKDPADPNGDTYTPVAYDSVKFAAGAPALMDLAGNSPNPKEIGVVIDGKNRFDIIKVPIVDLDPEFDLNDYLNNRFPPEFGIKFPEDLYTGGRHVELLPTPENWGKDEIKKYYPGSIGQVFKPDINGAIREYEKDYGPIPDSAITFYARAYYHTNLGTYVVESKQPLEVRCDNEIFKKDGQGSCRENRNGIYLAWDLKDAKNRWVGTGAYVEVYDFWWSIDYENPSAENKREKKKGVSIHETKDEEKKKIEMLGVKRVKGGKFP